MFLMLRLTSYKKIKGIGPSNAFGIKLFQTISERYAREKMPKKISLSSPQAVVNYLKEKIGREKKEHFVILALDSRDNLNSISEVSIGTLNASLVHPREVFGPAISHSASQIILAHNHPSGDPEPSEDDLVITKRLVEAGKILGIEVTEHVVISKKDFFSFKDKGLM